MTTFDYYRRSRQEKRHRPRGSMPLVKVELTRPVVKSTAQQQAKASTEGFTLVLANSRRIESGWQYADQELARLIRIVEAA